MAYSRRHYQLVGGGPRDTAETIAERQRARQAAHQISRELAARWPTLTSTNIPEALEYQERRFAELMAHSQDEHCTPHLDEQGTCRVCGVWHGGGCAACNGKGFHRDGCPEIEEDQP